LSNPLDINRVHFLRTIPLALLWLWLYACSVVLSSQYVVGLPRKSRHKKREESSTLRG
jgi:hypothetical protein